VRVISDWKDVNVDLNELTNRVEWFFKSKGLQTRRFSDEKRLTIQVTQKGKAGNLYVEISGNSSNFQVSFVLEDPPYSYRVLGSVFSVFFGGAPLLKNLKTRELFEKLESEFWAYLNTVVENLNQH